MVGKEVYVLLGEVVGRWGVLGMADGRGGGARAGVGEGVEQGGGRKDSEAAALEACAAKEAGSAQPGAATPEADCGNARCGQAAVVRAERRRGRGALQRQWP